MNKLFIIQFDISNDYHISEKIKTLGPWMTYFKGSFFLETELIGNEIYKEVFIGYEQSNILIMEIKRDGNYWGNMPDEAWKWLNSKLND
jgi:hypothetical protein